MTSPRTAERRAVRTLTASALAVLGSWVLAMCSCALAWEVGGASVPYSAVLASAALVTAVVVGLCLPRVGGGAHLRAASWTLLAWVPYLFCGAALELSEPLITGHWRCGTGDAGLVLVGFASMPVLFAFAAAVTAAVDRHRLAVATRVLGWTALVGALSLLAGSASRTHGHEPDAYVESLPVLTVLEDDDSRFTGSGFTLDSRPEPGQARRRCYVTVGDESRVFADECRGARVRRDVAHDLWIFQGAPGSGFACQAVHSDPQAFADVTVSAVSSDLRPPVAWMTASGLACLVGLGLFAAAFRVRRQAAAWRHAVAGWHDGKGWLTFERGAPARHAARASVLPEGPILALLPPASSPAYRVAGAEGTDEGRFVAGSFDDVRAAAEARGTGLYALATLVIALAMAPMLAAWASGLVG